MSNNTIYTDIPKIYTKILRTAAYTRTIATRAPSIHLLGINILVLRPINVYSEA